MNIGVNLQQDLNVKKTTHRTFWKIQHNQKQMKIDMTTTHHQQFYTGGSEDNSVCHLLSL